MKESESLAMAYVPRQTFKEIYPLDVALKKGTIFIELDKPFLRGNSNV